ncbi:MAG: alpha/beta hydrolase [Bacteroidota bacterium]
MNIKKFTALLILFLTGIDTLLAQNGVTETKWEGELQYFAINLKLSEDSLTKQMVAKLDIPSQNIKDIKASTLTLDNDNITVHFATLQAMYRGQFNKNKSVITGHWIQFAQSFNLTFAQKAKLIRPQTPVGPFPYEIENVEYYNKDRSIKYGATLTLPKLVKKAKAVILITGSGQLDRDETMMEHKPFWIIADHLSRNGIAVLRVDDRGIGNTTGNFSGATSADFANDVMVGLEYLKNHAGIDPKNIGLIGHSEGGIIGPITATQSNDVAFLVSMAGVGIKGFDLLNKQRLASLSKIGYTPEDINKLHDLYASVAKIAKENTSADTYGPAFGKFITEWLKQQPDPFLYKVGYKGAKGNEAIDILAGQFYDPWTRYLNNYDPATTLTKITVPVLALNGEKDILVSAKENLAGFNTLLTQAGNKNFKTISMPGLNHLFQHANTGEVTEYIAIEETISPEVLDIITKWIQGLKPRK